MTIVVGFLLFAYHSYKGRIKPKLINTLEKATEDAENSVIDENKYLIVMERLKVLNNFFDLLGEHTAEFPTGEWVIEEEMTCLRLTY
jgi:hypothetical protein